MGTVLKVVMIPRESWHDLEEVVLEEMTVFRVRPSDPSLAKSPETTDLHTLCVCLCVCFPAGSRSHHRHGAVHQTGTDALLFNRDIPRWDRGFYGRVFPFSATAVPGLVSGRLPDAAAPLRGVRESLRRVLPGPGPLLRLGRHRVFQILPHRQEVGGQIFALCFPSVFAELTLSL